MFESIKHAYQRSKPFLSSSYQAVSSGVTAGVYTLRTGADVAVISAYSAKAVIKTTYYGLKSLVTVAPAAYSYYTQEPKIRAAKDQAEEDQANPNPGFDFEAYDETLYDYNQAWDASAEEFSSTAHVFAAEVYPSLCDAATSFGKVLSSSWGCIGHAVKATGEGALLAKDAAEYCLGSEEPEICIADDYELVEEERAAAPVA